MGLKHLTFSILFALCGGTFLSFGVLRQSRVGKNYFRIHGVGLSVLVLLAYLSLGRYTMGGAATFWFSLFFVCSLAFSVLVGRDPRVSTAAFFLGAITFAGTLVLDITDTFAPTVHDPLLINLALSSGLLGFTMAAMLVGHWYLVQPKLSIEELGRTVWVMIAFTVVRLFYAIYAGWGLTSKLTETEAIRYWTQIPGLFVMMRVLWGIGLPCFLAFLVWKTVKIRSTQSATGILYVSVVAVLVGEILSHYLSYYHGIAF